MIQAVAAAVLAGLAIFSGVIGTQSLRDHFAYRDLNASIAADLEKLNANHATSSQNVKPPESVPTSSTDDVTASPRAVSNNAFAPSATLPLQGTVLGASTDQPLIVQNNGVTRDELDARIDGLTRSLLSSIGSAAHTETQPVYRSIGDVALQTTENYVPRIGGMLTNATVDGVSGLTDADLPDSLTASNYLPLTGGTLTGDLTMSGTLTAGSLSVAGISSSGALIGPSVTATSTTATSTFAGGLFANYGAFNSASFGATATSTFTSDGKLGIGTASPVGKLDIVVDGNGAIFRRYAAVPNIAFSRAQGSESSPTIVLNGGFLAAQWFNGYDGSSYIGAAGIQSFVDGTPGTNDMPGRITFLTTPDGSATALERIRIDNAGNLGVGTTTPGSLLSVGNTNGINFSTATSSFSSTGGINLAAGCFAIGGNCLSTGALGLTGTTGQVPYFSGTNTAVGTSTLFIATSGSVGVGTPSILGSRLHVQASDNTTSLGKSSASINITNSQNASDDLAELNFYGYSGSTDYVMAGISAKMTQTTGNTTGNLLFNTKNSTSDTALTTRMTILANGDVGIGTSPASKFEVSGGPSLFTNSGNNEIALNSSGANYGLISNNSSGVWSLGYGTTLGTLATPVLTWNSSGFVGIANTSPTYKLDVTGLGHFTGLVDAANFVATSTSATTTLAGQLAVGSNALNVLANGNVGLGTASPLSIVSTARSLEVAGVAYSTIFASTGSGNVRGLMSADNNNNSVGFGSYSNSRVDFFVNNGNPSMSISTGGNVGIGTTSPWGKLSVTNTGSGPSFVVEDSTSPDTTPFIVDASGNVGIGTASPSSKLQVVGELLSGQHGFVTPSDGSIRVMADNTGYGQIGFSNRYDNFAAGLRSYGVGESNGLYSRDLRFYVRGAGASASGGDEAMRLDYTGNVGIASTSPWRTLSVTGTVGFDGLTSSTGAGSLCLDSNKQVVYNSASDNCLSSTRATKHAIEGLSLDGLRIIDALQSVSFVYNQGDGRTRYGFIAEDTAAVDAHLATYDASGTVSRHRRPLDHRGARRRDERTRGNRSRLRRQVHHKRARGDKRFIRACAHERTLRRRNMRHRRPIQSRVRKSIHSKRTNNSRRPRWRARSAS